MENTTDSSVIDKSLFIVETVSTFKIRYAVEAKSLSEAKALVYNGAAEELTQEFLGETIKGGTEISEKQFLKQEFNEAYHKNWDDEKKLKMINKIKP